VSYRAIQSFVGSSLHYKNPVKDAVENATRLAEEYFTKWEDDCTIVVENTTTHIIGHGDYFSYVITMVLKMTHPYDEEEEES
jgi:hypothetical protein